VDAQTINRIVDTIDLIEVVNEWFSIDNLFRKNLDKLRELLNLVS
jgi:hypothetical protein